MSVREEQICRLCLKVAKKEFWKINEFVMQLLDVLLLKLDLHITRDPIICRECIEVAKQCLDFKTTCIYVEKCILLFCMARKKTRYSIKDIYEERELVKIEVFEDLNICRFCMARLESNNFVSVDTLRNESIFMVLPIYLPEMDYNIIEDPVICTACREHLVGYCKFLLNCLDIEVKIKAYCMEVGTDSVSQGKLDVLHFLFKDIFKYADQICPIKEKPNILEDTEYSYLEALGDIINSEEKYGINEEIDLEEDDHKNQSDIKVDKDDDMYYDTVVSDEEGVHLAMCSSEVKNIHEEIAGSKEQKVSEVKLHKCSLCAFKSKSKSYLNKHNMFVHKDVSEIEIYKCTLCAFKTKYKSSYKNHMFVHKDISKIKMYKCTLCAYETKYKGNLNLHMLVHNDVSEIKMFKCSLCAYEAKQKHRLTEHMIVHKDTSEIKMYKCSLCPHESKSKGNLNRHMFVHKDVSKINMYKCTLCPYEAKQKCRLTEHMIVHKDISKIKMYQCSFCTFQSKLKSNLNKHLLVHKDVSEIKMYKCSLCPYESKRKGGLKEHMLVHKNVAEINIFKCSLCPYEGKQRRSLKKHMLVHMDPLEIKMYKCSFCPYETNQNCNLKRHVTLIHDDIPETKMYKCLLCAYKCKLKYDFQKHVLVHKDV